MILEGHIPKFLEFGCSSAPIHDFPQRFISKNCSKIIDFLFWVLMSRNFHKKHNFTLCAHYGNQ